MKTLMRMLLCLFGADSRAALAFEAYFEKSVKANLAKGDARIYYAESYKEGSAATPGLGQSPVVHENGA
jgi:hypothetical protein